LVEKELHFFFGTSFSTKPQGPPIIKAGDYYPILMAALNRYLINTGGGDCLWQRGALYEPAQVRHFHTPYLIPAESVKLSNPLYAHFPALLTYPVFVALGEPG